MSDRTTPAKTWLLLIAAGAGALLVGWVWLLGWVGLRLIHALFG